MSLTGWAQIALVLALVVITSMTDIACLLLGVGILALAWLYAATLQRIQPGASP